MTTQANPHSLTLDLRHGQPTLTDPAGGVWWPTEDAAARIMAADDRLAAALAEEARTGTGTWSQ